MVCDCLLPDEYNALINNLNKLHTFNFKIHVPLFKGIVHIIGEPEEYFCRIPSELKY